MKNKDENPNQIRSLSNVVCNIAIFRKLRFCDDQRYMIIHVGSKIIPCGRSCRECNQVGRKQRVELSKIFQPSSAFQERNLNLVSRHWLLPRRVPAFVSRISSRHLKVVNDRSRAVKSNAR
jgi:hypothetical protein